MPLRDTLYLTDQPFRNAPAASLGFSLLELAISVALLMGVTLSALLLVVPVSKQTRLTREVEVASVEVRGVLEKIHATPFNQIMTIYPPGTNLAVSSLSNGNITVGYRDATAVPLEVLVTLSWDGTGGSYTRTFATVRTP